MRRPVEALMRRACIAASSALLACGGVDVAESPAIVVINVSTVTVAAADGASTSLLIGDSLRLVGTPRDVAGKALESRTVVWTSSDSRIASVTSTGIVVAIAGGTATISAASSGVVGSLVVTVRPLTSIAFTTCPTARPAETPQWVAAADGNEPWKRVLSVDGTYRVDIRAAKARLAFVAADDKAFTLVSVSSTADELKTYAANGFANVFGPCASRASVNVNAVLAGAGTDQVAMYLGPSYLASQSKSDALAPWKFGLLPPGTFDFLAFRGPDPTGQPTFSWIPSSMILRRAVQIPFTRPFATVDFRNSSETLPLGRRTLEVNNLQGGGIDVLLNFSTLSTGSALTSIFSSDRADAARFPFAFVPDSAMLPTDMHSLNLATSRVALSLIDTRGIAANHHSPGDLALTFGPWVGPVNFTPDIRAGVALPRIGAERQPEYGQTWTGIVLDGRNVAYLLATAGFLGEGKVELVAPDLSALDGWLPRWNLGPRAKLRAFAADDAPITSVGDRTFAGTTRWAARAFLDNSMETSSKKLCNGAASVRRGLCGGFAPHTP